MPILPSETEACTCAICADDADGFCVPWGNSSACDCVLDEPSTSAPFRQEFDFVQTPPCCRPEWPADLRLVQVSLQPEGLPVSYELFSLNGATADCATKRAAQGTSPTSP